MSSSIFHCSGCGPPLKLASDILRMNVVVGKSLNHQTPLFVEQIIRHLPAYLGSATEHRDQRVDSKCAGKIPLPGPGNWRSSPAVKTAPGPACDVRYMDAVIAGKLYIRQKPEPKQSWTREIHFPERGERVYARDSSTTVVRARPA